MLNWRNTLSAVEDAGEFSMDQLLSAANTAAKSAKEVSSQIESWASDGYETIRDGMKSEPAFWGVVTLGAGAMIGSLYALWRTSGKKPRRRRTARTMAVKSGMGRGMRSMSATPGKISRKRSRKSMPARRSAMI